VAFDYHGQHAEKEDFPSIKSTLPRYIFAEICFAPKSDSPFGKLSWWLRHGEAPELRQIVSPEPRTYEKMIAIPSMDFLKLNGIGLKPPIKPLPA